MHSYVLLHALLVWGSVTRTAQGHRVAIGDGDFAKSDLETDVGRLNATSTFCSRICVWPSYCQSRSDICNPQTCPELCKGGGGSAGEGDDKKVEELLAELDVLVGLDQVKDQMRELIAQVKFNMERKRLGLPDIGGQSLHMSFNGNPGTGKTVVARIVGQLMVAMGAIQKPEGGNPKEKGDVVHEVSRADLVAEYSGQTAPKVKKAVQKAMGGVLFIDEAYALVQGDRDSFGNEAVDTLIKEMEDNRDKLIVILAGYQTEMASFLAANPGFKSRVPFHFAFPDYTCDELVQIGELMLKKKNVGIVLEPSEASVCQPTDGSSPPSSCAWMKAAVKLRTGCCETKDCGKEENRANGNGRTLRNALEASYRNMARRVLSTFTPALLEEYSRRYRPSVSGRGKDARPNPPLTCGAEFEAVRHEGPYLKLEDLGREADVRCAFRLLETRDLQESLGSAIKDQLLANCMAVQKPVTVNTTTLMKKEGILTALDWEAMHQSLFSRRECDEPQKDLKRAAGLRGSQAALVETRANSTAATTGYCPPNRCSPNDDSCSRNRLICSGCDFCPGECTSSMCSPDDDSCLRLRVSCAGCSFCKAGRRRGESPVTSRPCPADCTSDLWCSAASERCGACPMCQGDRRGGSGLSPLEGLEPKLCEWAKRSLGHLERNVLQWVEVRSTCTTFLRSVGAHNTQGNMDRCQAHLPTVLSEMKLHGTDVDCGKLFGSSSNGHAGGTLRPAVGFGHGLRPDPGPLSRPGSKVEDLMKELNDLIGLEDVKAGVNSLRDAEEFDMWRKRFLGNEWSLLGQSFHMRFLGNPGTGKTVVARIVGKILVELEVVKRRSGGSKHDFVFKEVSRADLVAGYMGQTAPKVQAAVKSAFGGVLFIDEAYSLVQDDRDVGGREAVDTLIKEIEDHRDKVIVIFAGYSKEMESFFKSNPGFQSRVPFRFEFSDYSCEELAGIAEMQLRKQTVEMTEPAKDWVGQVVSARTGCCTKAARDAGECSGATRDNGNGRAVRNVLESALRSMSVRAVAETQGHKPPTRQLVTEMLDSDVASVAGQLIADALRITCKATGMGMPDLEALCTGPRILSVPSFVEALQMARDSCSEATEMLQGLKPVSDAVGSAMDIEIADPSIAALFADLDELIGLGTVKRTMRELFTTVEFAQLRKSAQLEPLKSQSFHMRFLGNPGTGKTVVARIVGKLLVGLGAIEGSQGSGEDPLFTEVGRSDLVAEYAGQTAMQTMQVVQKSLGGVLFLDEAYALVQGDRDSFGHEAVDTLIKEMEDKRKQLIVICAGYANEMEEFFQSNPGFKSRVPFTFYFEDYTCSELSEIGRLQLAKKKLEAPQDSTAFDQSIRFSTGCCDKLEDCEESKDKGNGRAVRNAIESSIRAMARRLADDGGQASTEKYSTMTQEDFRTTTRQMISSRLLVPCGANGELQKIINSVSRASTGILEGLPGEQPELVARILRLAEETRLVRSMTGLDEGSQALGEACHGRLAATVEAIVKKLQQVCAEEGGILTDIQRALQVEKEAATARMYANVLKGAVRDQVFMREVLRSAWTEEEAQEDAALALEKSCDGRLEALRTTRYKVPFDFVAAGL